MSTSALRNIGGGMFILVLVLTAVAVVAAAVLTAVGLLFAYMQVAGTAYPQAVAWLGKPTGILMIVACATASLILPVWLLLILRRKLSWEDLGWRRPSVKWVVLAVLLVLAYGFLSGWLYATIADESDMRAQVQDQIGAFIDLRNPNIFTITALLLVVGPLAGMIEELLFRGFVFGWIRARAPVVVAAAVSGILFALVHPYYVEPGGFLGIYASVEIFLLGVLLAWIYVRSGSIVPSIIGHATNNFVVTIYALATL